MYRSGGKGRHTPKAQREIADKTSMEQQLLGSIPSLRYKQCLKGIYNSWERQQRIRVGADSQVSM